MCTDLFDSSSSTFRDTVRLVGVMLAIATLLGLVWHYGIFFLDREEKEGKVWLNKRFLNIILFSILSINESAQRGWHFLNVVCPFLWKANYYNHNLIKPNTLLQSLWLTLLYLSHVHTAAPSKEHKTVLVREMRKVVDEFYRSTRQTTIRLTEKHKQERQQLLAELKKVRPRKIASHCSKIPNGYCVSPEDTELQKLKPKSRDGKHVEPVEVRECCV